MSLLTLPNELLLNVVYFFNSAAHINQFARTNRRLFDLVSPYLSRRYSTPKDNDGFDIILNILNKQIPHSTPETDLDEYRHPSQPTDADGLPDPVTEEVRNRDEAIARFVDLYKCNLDRYSDYGTTRLQDAARNRDETAFFLLVRNGADIFARSEPKEKTTLHWAAKGGSPRILRFLLKNKRMRVHTKDARDRTPLHYAMNEVAIRILFDHGADINAGDSRGQTPLHQAMGRELFPRDDWYYSGVRTFIELGADINHPAMEGETVLHRAIDKDPDTRLVRILLDSGADLEARDAKGRTPLAIAIGDAQSGNEDSVKLLVQCGADVNARDIEGWSILYRLVHSKNSYLMRYLLRKGAAHEDVGNGLTLLQCLEDLGDTPLINEYKKFIEQGR